MADMSKNSESELEKIINRFLSEEMAERGSDLAYVLRKILAKQSVKINPDSKNNLLEILQHLSGHNIATSDAIISFGTGNNLGDISIGDIAGGNIIKININLDASEPARASVKYYNDKANQHRLRLLELHRRRLYKLEEQEATFGSSCPPHILMEIEDISSRISHINNEIE